MAARKRTAFTLVELLVVIAIIGILVGILIPAVQYAREASRRTQCRGNLHQLGIAMASYHNAYKTFPAGCVGPVNDPSIIQGWGWGTFLLPHVEQQALYNTLDPNNNTLTSVVSNPNLQQYLRTPVSVYRCPSDLSDDIQSPERTLSGFMLGPPVDTSSLNYDQFGSAPRRLRFPTLLACIAAPPMPGDPGYGSTDGGAGGTGGDYGDGSSGHHNADGSSTGGYGVRTATSNYVGSFGDVWVADELAWTTAKLGGNGLFGSNAAVRVEDITDGASNTFAIGERSWLSYASIWAGTDGWDVGVREGVAMTLGTANYRLNASPDPYYLSADPQGAAGFGSLHPGGAHFLMADGSVRFVTDSVNFAVSTDPSKLGVFQRLARRNDGRPVVDN